MSVCVVEGVEMKDLMIQHCSNLDFYETIHHVIVMLHNLCLYNLAWLNEIQLHLSAHTVHLFHQV